MIVDRMENLPLYEGAAPGAKALAGYLAAHRAELNAPGSYPVPGTALVIRVMAYDAHAPGDVAWEAHRSHMDVHLTLSGDEGFGWMPAGALRSPSSYDAQRDLELYADKTPGSVIDVPEGYFVIVWPQDAHRPGMKAAGGGGPRLKGVVKLDCSPAAR